MVEGHFLVNQISMVSYYQVSVCVCGGKIPEQHVLTHTVRNVSSEKGTVSTLVG